jgi:hypothetical protein
VVVVKDMKKMSSCQNLRSGFGIGYEKDELMSKSEKWFWYRI